MGPEFTDKERPEGFFSIVEPGKIGTFLSKGEPSKG
jgi:hypothetical protein